MADKRYDSNWEKRKNQDPKQNEGRGSKEEAEGQRPQNRLKDGTNDLQSGDPDPGKATEKMPADDPAQNS